VAPDLRVVDREAVAAGLLRVVQGDVRLYEQLLGARAIGLVEEDRDPTLAVMCR